MDRGDIEAEENVLPCRTRGHLCNEGELIAVIEGVLGLEKGRGGRRGEQRDSPSPLPTPHQPTGGQGTPKGQASTQGSLHAGMAEGREEGGHEGDVQAILVLARQWGRGGTVGGKASS